MRVVIVDEELPFPLNSGKRIRTYNFPENRVTDHRINLTLYKLDQILAGAVSPLTEALIAYDRDQLRGSMDSDMIE